jgi:hypothetical protein
MRRDTLLFAISIAWIAALVAMGLYVAFVR